MSIPAPALAVDTNPSMTAQNSPQLRILKDTKR